MSGSELLRRVGQAALVLALAYTVAYVLLAALPGDAVLARYGNPDLGLTPEQLDGIRRRTVKIDLSSYATLTPPGASSAETLGTQ